MSIKLKISENFSKASSQYHKEAALQKTIADSLVELANPYLKPDSKIIDLGSGTGFIAQKLNKDIYQLDIAFGMCQQSKKLSPTICADIEKLPVADKSFDAAFSSSVVQWLNSLETAFKEVNRILNNNGYFFFTTFGEGTLSELKACYKSAGLEPKTLDFIGDKQIEAELNNSKFEILSFNKQEYKLEFSSVIELLKSITDIGAGASFSGENNLTKENLSLIERNYKDRFSKQGKLQATWEVFYILCKKYS